MGSFVWDSHPCCVQYHNGRPLSVALTEPADENEISSFAHSDFAIQCRPRSQSSGRRFQRESYRIYHPNVQYATFNYCAPFQQRVYDYGSSREGFLEKFETITIEEQCRPRHQCVRRSATPVRQVKIRSRPSSCFDLQKKEVAAAAADNNQWTQVVDERTEEHHNWHYNFTIPLQTSASTHTASIATQHEDVRIPITAPIRPLKKDTWTSTEDLPKKARRPLSISETQVLERYEKNEKIRRDSLTERSDAGTFTQVLTQRPLHRSYDDDDDDVDNDDDSGDEQPRRTSRKLQRKDFLQRMHTKNGTRSLTSMNIYPECLRSQMIVRPTVKPREALVDAPAIVAPPTEAELTPRLTVDTQFKSRHYLGPI